MADYFWFSNSTTNTNWNSTGGNSRWYSASGGNGTRKTAPPTSTDNAIFDAASGTGPCNFGPGYQASCLNLYCNGYLGVGPTTTQISGGSGTAINVYGAVQLSPNQIFDVKQYPKIIMTGTAAGSINCNGNTFGDIDIAKTDPAVVTLNDDLIGTGNAVLNLISGTLDANNKNVTFGNFYTGGTSTRQVNMGSGTWTLTFEGELTGISFNTWEINTTTGLTFNAGTSTIKLCHPIVFVNKR